MKNTKEVHALLTAIFTINRTGANDEDIFSTMRSVGYSV